MQQNLERYCFVLMAILTVGLILPSRALAQSAGDLTVAEQWVLQQTRNGNIADLAIQFPNEEDRILGADFIEKLLSDPSIVITRFGIRIKNAVFQDPINLSGIDVRYRVWLENCHFKSTMNLHEAHFHEEVSFASSTFTGWVFMGQMITDRELRLKGAIFQDQITLSYAQIGLTLELDDTQFINDSLTAKFDDIVVRKSMFLNRAVFAGPVDFSYADIGVSIIASDVQFKSATGATDFSEIRAGYSVFLRGARFAGRVDFGNANVGNNFIANNAQFNSEAETVYFGQMNVGYSVFLRGATFAGPVDFKYVEIGNNLEADDAQFTNPLSTIYFGEMNVGYSVFLRGATFDGPVDFRYVKIGNNLEANDVQFNSPIGTAYFGQMKAGYSVFLQRAIFAGPVDFRYVDIGNNLEAQNAQFTFLEQDAIFWSLRVRNSAFLTDVVFAGPVDFQYSNIGDSLFLNNTRFEDSNKGAVFSHVKIGDGLILSKTLFAGPVDLTNADCSLLYINDTQWTMREGHTINVNGLVYNSVEAYRDGKDAWSELVLLVEQSPYDAESYKTLESFFDRQGYPERADEVYITYKNRERSEALSWTSLDWWWNLVLGSLIGYGRKPALAIGWGTLFVVTGWFLFFREENMISLSKREIIGPKVAKRGTLSRRLPMKVISSQEEYPYDPFWYSLDLFIPFIDLGFDDKWSPKPNRKLVIVYSKIHMLVGWILIPIGLLTLTGIVK